MPSAGSLAVGWFSLLTSILLGIIIGLMFGWELGIGVALFVAGAGFISTGNNCLGIILIIPALALFATSLLRIKGKIGVNIKMSALKFKYLKDRSVPNVYYFSGEIEAKTPIDATIRSVCLGVILDGQERMVDLMWNEERFGKSYVLSSSHSVIQIVSFQLESDHQFKSLPKQGTIYFNTTEWERKVPVGLEFEVTT